MLALHYFTSDNGYEAHRAMLDNYPSCKPWADARPLVGDAKNPSPEFVKWVDQIAYCIGLDINNTIVEFQSCYKDLHEKHRYYADELKRKSGKE